MDREKINAALSRITELTMVVLLEHSAPRAPDEFTHKAHALIEHCLAVQQRVPVVGEVAKILCMSGATLRRHLHDEGSSFQKLLDESRMRLAKHLLANNRSVDDVTYLLGFSASAGFSRAFKDWVGIPPTEYREKWSMNTSLSGKATRTRTVTSKSLQRTGRPLARRWCTGTE